MASRAIPNRAYSSSGNFSRKNFIFLSFFPERHGLGCLEGVYENRIVLQFALHNGMQEATGIVGKGHSAFAHLRRPNHTLYGEKLSWQPGLFGGAL